ncbi:alternate signal-mediated exported protein%2C CPF_0494 family [uncultured Clostridium sp.]|uniref:hypothetical protein n=1 Tax=uncultured Clostridium sp. TaxID=59620 RepID=UPI000820E227|nr:hypothetical protein [uncultured Clostridium sp.]SCJ39925.1 alternate signal-mediated exported protein%2C CPF_0494 family [uncultured Clostridium sp.]
MKHAKRSKFEKFLIKNKAVLLLCTTIILVASILNSSYAFFIDKDKVVNKFQTGKIDVDIKEEFDPSIGKKEVWIENPSATDSLVRVSISGRWIDPNNEYTVIPEGNNLVELKFAENYNENWYYCQEDGYYYYKDVLKGKVATEILLEKVIFNDEEISKDKIYEGKEYKVEIKAEAVQATKHKDYDNENNSGDIYVFSKVWNNLTEEVTNMLKTLIDTINLK